MTIHEFTCIDCGETKSHDNHGCGGTGYAKAQNGGTICYACCGIRDQADMDKHGNAILYLFSVGNDWALSNWPATLKIPLHRAPRKGRHNIAGNRYDVWFQHNGADWHGVQYGENTQICRCKRLKGKQS